jgi:hypothetical protein
VLAQQKDQVIKLNADLVVIDVTVTDKDGNFIRNLKAEDFAIYEDNKPQKIDFFEMWRSTMRSESFRISPATRRESGRLSIRSGM